jgi:hypothetical protein
VVVLLFSISIDSIVVKLPFVFVHVVAAKEPLERSGDDAVHIGAMQRKSTGRTTTKKMVLMITDGVITRGGSLRGIDGGTRLSASSQKASLMFHDYYHNDNNNDEDEKVGEDEEEEGGTGNDDIKWDSMFQDLKPT